MTEEWRPIKLTGYTKLYEVSNKGRVRSVNRSVHRVRIHGATHKVDSHKAHFTSKLIKPYYVAKDGCIRYHLHRRVKSGVGGQEDKYVYVEDLIRSAFPELYSNCDRELIRWRISK